MYSVSSNTDITQAGSEYIANRKRWSKPQAMIWSRTPGVVVKSGENTGLVSPTGEEGTNFIVISDHNRSPISMDQQRLESRSRMVSVTCVLTTQQTRLCSVPPGQCSPHEPIRRQWS